MGKPDGLILNADNGLEKYKIRVESDTGDIIVDMMGVVDGGETDAGSNNEAIDNSVRQSSCASDYGSATTRTGPSEVSTSPVSPKSSCGGTLCGRSTSEPISAKIQSLRDSTSCTLDNSDVETISPGSASNPQNVKHVEAILSETKFDELFPKKNAAYTYTNFLKAIGKYPAICSDTSLCPKILANMFGHFQQETAGLFYIEEVAKSAYCADWAAWVTDAYPCVPGKMYFGRGAKQLSWNYNYGAFSAAMFGDAKVLLNEPELVATTWLNFAATMWFFVSPQPPKPSMLQVLDGSWVPNSQDNGSNLKPGFGVTTMIINGGIECGKDTLQAKNRAKYYTEFAEKLGVDITGEKLNCNDMQSFPATGSAAMDLYWAPEQDCKLVSWQTAFSALVEGDYNKCKGIHSSCTSNTMTTPAPAPVLMSSIASSLASPTATTSLPKPSASCDSAIVDRTTWPGFVQAKLKTVLSEGISSYSITLETDTPLTDITFWTANISPKSGNKFTLTNSAHFQGIKAGGSLDLAFMLSFSGDKDPMFTSIVMNGVSPCEW